MIGLHYWTDSSNQCPSTAGVVQDLRLAPTNPSYGASPPRAAWPHYYPTRRGNAVAQMDAGISRTLALCLRVYAPPPGARSRMQEGHHLTAVQEYVGKCGWWCTPSVLADQRGKRRYPFHIGRWSVRRYRTCSVSIRKHPRISAQSTMNKLTKRFVVDGGRPPSSPIGHRAFQKVCGDHALAVSPTTAIANPCFPVLRYPSSDPIKGANWQIDKSPQPWSTSYRLYFAIPDTPLVL